MFDYLFLTSSCEQEMKNKEKELKAKEEELKRREKVHMHVFGVFYCLPCYVP